MVSLMLDISPAAYQLPSEASWANKNFSNRVLEIILVYNLIFEAIYKKKTLCSLLNAMLKNGWNQKVLKYVRTQSVSRKVFFI